MRTAFREIARPKFAASVVVVLLSLFLLAQSSKAAQLREAQVTQIVKDVQVLPTQAAPKAASINDSIRQGTAVRTGDESRTELTFTDQTLALTQAHVYTTVANYQSSGGTGRATTGMFGGAGATTSMLSAVPTPGPPGAGP